MTTKANNAKKNCLYQFNNFKDLNVPYGYTRDKLFDKLMDADPKNGENCYWLIREYKKNQFRLEDVERVRNDLDIFIKNNRSLPVEERSLTRYTYSQLKKLVEKWNPTEISFEPIPSDDPDIDILSSTEWGILSTPKTEEASCKLGKGTKWCTAARENNMFGHYSNGSNLYVWNDFKRNKKYQFHFETAQFMDKLDDPIESELLRYFATEHPILSKFFKANAYKIPNDALKEYINYWRFVQTEILDIVTKNPEKIVIPEIYDLLDEDRVKSIILNMDKDNENDGGKGRRQQLLKPAVQYNNIGLVELLLDNGVNINSERDILFFTNNIEMIKFLLDHGARDNINDIDKSGNTVLSKKIGAYNSINIIKLLLENGATASINVVNTRLETPLYLASTIKNNIDMMKLLLENGAKDTIDVVDRDGNTLLGTAIKKREVDTVKLLLTYGANPNMSDKQGKTILETAIENREVNIVNLLLAYGANPNMPNKWGTTPLQNSFVDNKFEIAKLLLDHGANPTILDKSGWIIPLYMNMLKLLLENGVDPNTQDKRGSILLIEIIRNIRNIINNNLVELLLDYGANINITDEVGNTPLHMAVTTNNIDIVRLLLEHGASGINQPTNDGKTPLYSSVINNYTDMVRLLLENGANPNILDKYGNSPLYSAINRNNIDIVGLLLEHGASGINQPNNDGKTPLYSAVINNKIDMIRLLLENGADPNILDKYGNSPLYTAINSYPLNIDIVRLLLKNGADPNILGNSPLYSAINRGHTDIVRLLLEYGANPNILDKYGNSLLYLAINKNNIDIVRLLLENGADPDIPSKYENINPKIIEILQTYKMKRTVYLLMLINESVLSNNRIISNIFSFI